MSNETSEQHKQTIETLQEIRDRLPVPSQPLQIKSDDQAGLNANLEAIASGKATVIPADVIKPTYDRDIRQIARTDQRAINASLTDLASGKAIVIDV